jgi:cytochrome c peroxidase
MTRISGSLVTLAALAMAAALASNAQDARPEVKPRGDSSYMPVVSKESFDAVMSRMKADKPKIAKRQADLLAERYDLASRAVPGVAMTRGKAVQAGPRARLPQGVTWDALGAMAPEEIQAKGAFPAGFLPLPHPNHPEGGMLFPKFHIDEILKQENRDLTRFDLDYDLPDHFLPEFPPPIFLTTRPDLGDVSQGQLVTIMNFQKLFEGILNPKQIEGLRLLVTPFPQQQFNQTEDRRSALPHRGVSCLECHVNGHTNAATHLVGDIRPQEFRHRIDTPSLRGLFAQKIFGSQRSLSSVEDFTEFEQRAAYFDGDPVIATKKGVNVLERGSQVHFMSEMEKLFDFPPAPKLRVDGRLDPRKASEAEMRGQQVFFGKGQCSTCHVPPYYTDSLMHNLRTERFYKPRLINGRFAAADGPIKTVPLRGIKESPPYLHDGRLLTLEDTIEFFNLVLEAKLTPAEKKDLLAFLLAL